MSNVLDRNEIVLTFNKEDFDKNTAAALKTLESLKERLTGEATVKSMESLGKSAEKLNFSGIADSIKTVGKRMKFMGVVGASVINKLTNHALDSGIQIAKALPQQIIQGGWNRAMNIEKAQFLIEGLGFTWKATAEQAKEGVKDVFTAVDNAVTGTAYALDEAALVASNFLSSGITDINQLEKSLKAVSGLASVVSADYGDIGRIYAQVAGQGRMMGDDLLQLSQRGIGAASEIAKYLTKNKDVAKQATETAIAQGKQVKKMEEIQKHAKITEADVREMVSAGAISFDILVGATEKFFEQAQKANDTYTGSLSNLKSAFNRLGETFETSKLKNLTRIFNALIPVVKRLKEVLTPFTDKISEMSTKTTDIAVKAIKSLAKTMGVDFAKAETKGFFRFAEGLSRFEEDVEKTKETIDKGNKDVAKGAIVTAREWQAALDIWYKGSYGTGQKRADEIRKLGMSYENVQGIINKFYKNKFDWDKTKKGYNIVDETKQQEENNKAVSDGAEAAKDQNRELSALGKTITGVMNLAKSFANVLKAAVNTIKSIKNALSGAGNSIFDSFSTGFLYVSEVVLKFTKTLSSTMKKIAKNGKGFRTLVKEGNILALAFKGLKKAADAVGKVISGISNRINKAFKVFKDAYKTVKSGSKELGGLGKTIKGFLNTGKAIKNFLEGFSNLLGKVVAKLKEFSISLKFDGLSNFFNKVGDKLGGWILSLSEKLLKISERFKNFTETLILGGKEAEKLTSKGTKLGRILDKFKKIGSDIKDAFGEIGKIISDKTIKYFDKIEDVFKHISGLGNEKTGLGVIASLLIHVGEAFGNFLTGLATGESTAGSFFSAIGSFAHDFLSVVSDAFEWVLDHIGPAIDKIVQFFKELSKSEGFEKLKSALSEVVDSMVRMANSGFDKVVGWFKEIGATTFNSTNMNKMIDFFSGLAGGVGDFISKINKGESPIKGFLDTFSKTKEVMSFKYQAKKSIGEQFRDVVNAPALASSLNQVKKLNIGQKTLDSADVLTKFTTKLSDGFNQDNLEALTGETFENLKEANWDKVSKIALRIVSIGAIIKSTKDLGQLAGSIGGIAKSISGFFGSLRGISDSIAKSIRIESFRTMAIAIALIAGSIAALAVIPKDKMLPAAGVILAFMGMMLSILKITTRKEFNPRTMLDVGLAFAGMGAGMLLISGAVAKLGKLDPAALARGGTAILIFMGAMVAISVFGKSMTGLGLVFVGLAVAVSALAGAVAIFAQMDPDTFASGMLRVVAGMFSLALAARIAGRGAKGIASFFAIAAALYALIPAIILLALIPTAKAIQGVLAISFVMLSLGAAARLAASGEGFKAMASMATTIGVLAASLVVLSFINPDRLATAVLSLISVIATIALSSAIMKEAKLAALTMVGVIAGITGAIVLLMEINPDAAIGIAQSLSMLVTGIAIAAAACALVGKAGPAAFVGIGVMAAIIAAMVGVILGLGKLGEIDWVMKKVESFGNFMGKLGEAFGKFKGGMAKGMADNLGDSATKLKAFTDVMIPLLQQLSNIDTDGIGALKDLASAILAITGGGILDKLGSKIGSGGKQNMDGFGASLDSLAENFIPFVRKLNEGEGIGKGAIEKVRSFGDAVKVFADVAGALPKTSKVNLGPLKATFGQVDDLDDFASDVKKAAKSIGKAAEESEDFDETKVKIIGKVGEAITTMSDIAGKLPKIGVLPTLKGKTDLGNFAEDLGTFVPKFKTFSDACGKAADEATFGRLDRVKNVAAAVGAMAEAAGQIPPNTRGFHPIEGKKQIGKFAEDLGSFVPSFKKFSDACGNAADEATFGRLDRVKNVAASVKAMAEAAEMIPTTKGGGGNGASLGNLLNGEGGLSAFANDLSTFVDPFYKFSYKVGKHNKVFSEDNLAKVGLIGKALSALADVKAKVSGVVEKAGSSLFDWGTETGEGGSLESFGTGLEAISGNLKTFIEKTKDLDDGEIAEAKAKIESVVGLLDVFKGGDKKGGSFVLPDTSGLVDFATNMGEFGRQMITVEVDEEHFSAIATYLTTFKNKLNEIDIPSINEKAEVVQKVGEAVTKFNEIGDIPTGKNLVSLASNVYQFCTNMATADPTGIAEKADEVKKAVKKLASAAKSAAGSKDGGADLSKSGSSVAGSYITGLKNKAEDAKKAGETLAKNAKSGAGKDSYVTGMKTIGSNLGNAVATGLNNAYPAVSAAAEKIISKAKEAAEAKAKISSPSKVFLRIGNYLGEGLVIGIRQYEGEVYNASYNMADQSVRAANLAIQGLDDMASPTITPVIDLSNVRKGANAIDAMVSSSKALDINASVNSAASRYATPGMVSKLFDKINDMAENSINVKVTDGMNGASIVNNIQVDGTENPEDFANRFVNQLRTQMRMV